MSEKLSKFVTREYVKVNSLSNTYNENKSIRFKTPMLRSNLCDYSDAYILVKGKITLTAPGVNNYANNIRDKRNRPGILKNNAPFVSCITRINGKLLTNLKSGFKREIIWNKYRSQMTTEAVNNNLNILIDPTFTNVNRLFVLAYRTADDGQLFSQFYLARVMVKDYNVIIDKLAFFDLPMKTEEKAMKKL